MVLPVSFVFDWRLLEAVSALHLMEGGLVDVLGGEGILLDGVLVLLVIVGDLALLRHLVGVDATRARPNLWTLLHVVDALLDDVLAVGALEGLGFLELEALSVGEVEGLDLVLPVVYLLHNH